MLLGSFLTACGIYAYIFQEPQFAIPAGGSIQKGTINQTFQGIGWTTIAGITITIIILGIIVYCTKEIWVTDKNNLMWSLWQHKLKCEEVIFILISFFDIIY